ncbi:polyprenyl synthetase family protein [Streptomyces sp. NPDC101150]|uniref:polyprenyl synthetase family protein n=1 Tax=Streptomyces sp. NPDC101150 TaxID=3366114 RepID=UPI00380283EB
MGRAADQGASTVDLGLEEIRTASDAVLEDLLNREAGTLRELGLVKHLDAIRPLLLSAQGKRMRAMFCFWGWRGAGANGSRRNVEIAATALELQHSAFLIHDDMIDRSKLRRGQPTVYRRMADHHAGQGWHGSSTGFGDATALTLGDLCFAWASELIEGCTHGERLTHVLAVYHRMYADAAYGQLLDAQVQADRAFLPQRCLAAARFKAARYMVAPPLQIGAALAGADPAVREAYGKFGAALGEAYQLRDDVLGVFGNPAETGKPNLDDLREGKPTFLFATALQRADRGQRERLLNLYGDRDLDDDSAGELRSLIQDTKAHDVVESVIRARAGEAEHILKTAPITSDARTALALLANRALFRTR